MKLSIIKSIISAALFLITAALPIEIQAKTEREPFAQQLEYSSPSLPSGTRGPNRTEGNANGEIDFPPPAPVSEGLWILAGLGVAYGVVCRRRKHSRLKERLELLLGDCLAGLELSDAPPVFYNVCIFFTHVPLLSLFT